MWHLAAMADDDHCLLSMWLHNMFVCMHSDRCCRRVYALLWQLGLRCVATMSATATDLKSGVQNCIRSYNINNQKENRSLHTGGFLGCVAVSAKWPFFLGGYPKSVSSCTCICMHDCRRACQQEGAADASLPLAVKRIAQAWCSVLLANMFRLHHVHLVAHRRWFDLWLQVPQWNCVRACPYCFHKMVFWFGMKLVIRQRCDMTFIWFFEGVASCLHCRIPTEPVVCNLNVNMFWNMS